jgi:hypothetical protein
VYANSHACPFAPVVWNIVLRVTKRHISILMYMYEKLEHCMCYCLYMFSFVHHFIELYCWGHSTAYPKTSHWRFHLRLRCIYCARVCSRASFDEYLLNWFGYISGLDIIYAISVLNAFGRHIFQVTGVVWAISIAIHIQLQQRCIHLAWNIYLENIYLQTNIRVVNWCVSISVFLYIL